MLINLDFFKTFLNFLKATPRDWEEKNKESLGYIKNKPFYIEEYELKTREVYVLNEITLPFQDMGYDYLVSMTYPIGLEAEKYYTVVIDGVEYQNVKCWNNETWRIIGDMNLTDYPFSIGTLPGQVTQLVLQDKSVVEHTICITATEEYNLKKFTTIIPAQEIQSSSEGIDNGESIGYRFLEENETYVVNWDGVDYTCVAKNYNGDIMVGNNAIYPYDDDNNTDSGEPFAIASAYMNSMVYTASEEEETHTVSISGNVYSNEPKKLHMKSKYVPHFQSDWEENDETKLGYVQNRPLWMGDESKIILPKNTYSGGDVLLANQGLFEEGKPYLVVFDGVEYECLSYVFINGNVIVGNGGIVNISEDTGEPFFIYSNSMTGMYMKDTNAHTVEILQKEKVAFVNDEYLSAFQSNWAEENDKKTTYIHNRPFHLEPEKTVIVPQFEYDFDGSYYREYFEIIDGKTYFVNFDGTEYECVGFEDDGNFYLGDSNYNNYPFVIRCYGDGSDSRWRVMNDGLHTFEISTFVEYVVINDRYKNSLQSDWNESNESRASFIKNKPFYEDKGSYVVLDTTIDSFGGNHNNFCYCYLTSDNCNIDKNSKIDVIFGEDVYTNVSFTYISEENCYDIGAKYDEENQEYIFDVYPFNIFISPNNNEIGVCKYYSGYEDEESSYVKIVEHRNAVIKLDDKYQHQADWKETNSTKASFIVNKPFGEKANTTIATIVDNLTSEDYENDNAPACNFVIGETYTVIWNGEVYENLVCHQEDGYNVISNNETPFYIDDDGGNNLYISSDDDEPYTVSIIGNTTVISIEPIGSKYLPEHLQFGECLGYEYVTIVEEEFVYSGDYYSTTDNELELGKTYRVIVNENICDVEGIDYDGDLCLTDDQTFYIDYGDGNIGISLSPEFFESGTNVSVTIQELQECEYIKTIDTKYLPEIEAGVSYEKDQELTDEQKQIARENIGAASLDDIKKFNVITMVDTVNGYEYFVEMQNGQLVSYCETDSIQVTTMPTKTEYEEGSIFDTTGMIISAIGRDGTSREVVNYSYSNELLTLGLTSITIIYVERGIEFTVDVPITVKEDVMIKILVDFEYDKNSDGTYTLTEWKETLNGESSTTLFVPDYSQIII